MKKSWQLEIMDDREKAEALAARLRAEGWDAAVMPYGNRKFEVYADRWPTEAERIADLIESAAAAAAWFGEDDLEAYAESLRKEVTS